MTGEELARRPDLNPCELVNGRVVPMAPAGHIHGEIESRLGDTLRDEEILSGFALPLAELFQD